MKVILPLMAAIVSFALLLAVERRAKDPVIRLGFFRNRQISIAGTALIGMLMASMTTGVFPTVFRGVVSLLVAMLVLSLWLEGKPHASAPSYSPAREMSGDMVSDHKH